MRPGLSALILPLMMAFFLSSCQGKARNLASVQANANLVSLNGSFQFVQNPPTSMIPNSTIAMTYNYILPFGGLQSLFISFACDGITFGALNPVTVNANKSVSWTAPNQICSGAKLELIAIDIYGNQGIALSTPFQISSIALTSMTGGGVYGGGSVQAVTWTALTTGLVANSFALSYSANNGISWTPIASGLANTGSYNWTLPSITNTQVLVQLSASYSNGPQTSTSASVFTIDSILPTVSGLTVNGTTSGANTVNNYVPLALTLSDSVTNATYVCAKSNSTTPPLATDPCWIPVNLLGVAAGSSVLISNYPYLIGFTPGVYSIYAYAKNLAGNISALTNSGVGTLGTDKVTITYSPGSPSTLVNVIGSATATPSSPLTAPDQTVTSGGNVYVQWDISSAPNGLGATPISIYYTTDSVNYTLVTSGLSNGANGCAPQAGNSGCYLWSGGSPTSNYFQLRVTVNDSLGMITAATSEPMNVSTWLGFLAGNTDPGTGASATAALFSNYINAYEADPGSLAIAENGTVYFRDINRGILMVSPINGIQQVLLPLNYSNSSSYGDGGPVASATVKAPYRITVDFSGNLLVWDYDRIRKVNTQVSPMTIATIIGGGASTTDGVSPLNVQFTNFGALFTQIAGQNKNFFALPSGDIYFQSDNYASTLSGGYRIRVYQASSNQVNSIYFSGTGDAHNSSQSISTLGGANFGLTYNPSSSTILSAQMDDSYGNCYVSEMMFDVSSLMPLPATIVSITNPNTATYPNTPYGLNYACTVNQSKLVGHDGNLYAVAPGTGYIYKYNYNTNAWSTILGNGTVGTCADGTSASSCAASPVDAWVSAAGQVYFMDRGKVRTINSSGNVVTIMGQGFSFGDGGAPLSARFNVVNSIDQIGSGAIIALDQNEARFRQFTVGGTINTIAGNGSDVEIGAYNPGVAATTTPITISASSAYYDDFKADPTTGDIFFTSFIALQRLVTSTGKWERIAGGGATIYPSADGDAGSSINFYNGKSFLPRVIGWDGSNILAVPDSNNGTNNTNAWLGLYDGTLGTQSYLAGTSAVNGNTFCNPGSSGASSTLATNCGVPDSQSINNVRASYDSYVSPPRWVASSYETSTRVSAFDINMSSYANTGYAYTLTTLPANMKSFTYRHDASNNVVYYCNYGDNKIHKCMLGSNPTAASQNASCTDTTYTWPIASMACTGRTLVYSSLRNSLIFPFTLNGVYGVAEYVNP